MLIGGGIFIKPASSDHSERVVNSVVLTASKVTGRNSKNVFSNLSREFLGEVFFQSLASCSHHASIASSYNCSIGSLPPCDASVNSLSILDRI
jgi:hypothetical protein